MFSNRFIDINALRANRFLRDAFFLLILMPSGQTTFLRDAFFSIDIRTPTDNPLKTNDFHYFISYFIILLTKLCIFAI